MPSVPTKWMADMMMKTMGKYLHDARVEGSEYLNNRFLKVTFQSDDFKTMEWSPGMEVEFRVSNTQFRHYTVSRWNAGTGHLDILFFLHGNTPGSNWARALVPAETVTVIGPAGRFLLDQACTNHVFLGDETTIGLFLAFRDCLGPGSVYSGAIECDGKHITLPHRLGLEVDAVKRWANSRGQALSGWLADTLLDIEDATYYIAGHAATNKLLQRRLMDYGVPSSRIKVKAYWADGKKGL